MAEGWGRTRHHGKEFTARLACIFHGLGRCHGHPPTLNNRAVENRRLCRLIARMRQLYRASQVLSHRRGPLGARLPPSRNPNRRRGSAGVSPSTPCAKINDVAYRTTRSIDCLQYAGMRASGVRNIRVRVLELRNTLQSGQVFMPWFFRLRNGFILWIAASAQRMPQRGASHVPTFVNRALSIASRHPDSLRLRLAGELIEWRRSLKAKSILLDRLLQCRLMLLSSRL